ncbi:MAG TPA: HEPN domain-containing protein [Vineibacter sp.]|nr:HEPN domain-containing protein [Vineibacter sp.]
MRPEIVRRLAKAERFLKQCHRDDPVEDTESLITNAYYAMYHAATAFVMACGERPPKTHSQMVGAFGLRMRDGDNADREAGRSLRAVHDLRLLADYDDAATIAADRAVDARLKAVAFISHCRALIEGLP